MQRDPRSLACALLLALGCAASDAGEGPRRDSVAWLVQHERYEEAVRVAAEAAAQDPDDGAAQVEHRRASVAWLLHRGRSEFLAGRTEEALGHFRAAEELEPWEPAVVDWILATQSRMADEAYARGLSAHVDSDFDTAMVEYEAALGFQPDHAGVRAALARLLVQKNYRSGMGKGYYDDGIVALDRYFLYEASTFFANALKYQPGNERAELRGQRARELLATDRAAIALAMEEGGQYAAARNEYRLALLLDGDLELAQLGLERMKREEAVAERIREAQRLLLRKSFDEADALLAAQLEHTDRQQEEIAAARQGVGEARIESLYEAARTLESDWRYEEAVEAYDRLLEAATFYKDALTRRDTLNGFVRDARELYARFEQAQDDAERLAILRQIAIFWPEYRDVGARLAELE